MLFTNFEPCDWAYEHSIFGKYICTPVGCGSFAYYSNLEYASREG